MNFEVTEAHLVKYEDHNSWQVAYVVRHDNGDSENRVQVFPEDVINWRIAQFGLKQDILGVLKIILAEPFLKAGVDEDMDHASRINSVMNGGSVVEGMVAEKIMGGSSVNGQIIKNSLSEDSVIGFLKKNMIVDQSKIKSMKIKIANVKP